MYARARPVRTAATRCPGAQPRILLTNVKQLELLLTRQVDRDNLLDAARPAFEPSKP
jgi:hypothetical protein